MSESREKTVQGQKGVAEHIWRFFSSIRLAFALIIIIALISLLGAIIIQVPGEYTASPELFDNWVSNIAQPKYGMWTPLMSNLQLFNIFHSPWFLGAGVLLMLNILVCSINRWRRIRLLITGGKVTQPENFYRQGKNYSEYKNLNQSPEIISSELGKLLKNRAYRVRTEKNGDNYYIAGDKNRYFRSGTYASHLSLILFVLGFIIGSVWGFNDNSFIVVEGEKLPVGHGSELSLELVSFEDEYWSDGTPKDYRSEVILYNGNDEARRTTIRVNHPLIYKGIRFYQSYYGPAVHLEIKDFSGTTLRNSRLPLTDPLDDPDYLRYGGYIDLPQSNVYLLIVNSAQNAEDPIIKENEIVIQLRDRSNGNILATSKLERGVPLEIGGFEVTYIKDLRYSGFQVNYDPGNWLIWTASGLFLAGLAVVLYIPHHQFWALASSDTGGQSRLQLRMNTSRSLSSGNEFEILTTKLEQKLKQPEE